MPPERPGDPTVAAPVLDRAAVAALAPDTLFRLDGRVAIVTGAAGGLGRWFAAGLGAAGASVLVTDIDGEPSTSSSRVLERRRRRGRRRSRRPRRRGRPGADRRRGRRAARRRPRPRQQRRRQPADADPRDGSRAWDWITRIDLRLPYFLSRAAARRMIEQGSGGSIVSISSLNALYALEQISVYGPAKAGLSQLTKVMALEWAEHGIRANAIAPGFMDTPLAAPIWADGDMSRWILNRVPVERPGLPRELVGACLLLASDAGSFLTGQTLHVDGGASAGGRWFHPDR